MTEAEFLRRIDEHIAQTKVHIARGNELFAENRQVMAEVKEELGGFREELGGFREELGGFKEELGGFKEVIAEVKVELGGFKEVIAEVKEELALNRRDREETRLFMRDIVRRHEIVLGEISSEAAAGRQMLLDVHEESKAHRQAIWTLIDELREHGLGGRG